MTLQQKIVAAWLFLTVALCTHMIMENIDAIHFKAPSSTEKEHKEDFRPDSEIKPEHGKLEVEKTNAPKPEISGNHREAKVDQQNSMKIALRIKNLLVLVVPLIFGFVSVFYSKKWFKWTAFIYAILFALLNFAHAGNKLQ